MRNPRRTAVTAAALMIGLSLIAALSVVGNSLKASVDKLFANTVKAEYQVMDSVGGRSRRKSATTWRRCPACK
jgi:putative ABC transport system permease protein